MKGLYISIFVLGTLFGKAQTALYNKLNNFIKTQTKETVSDKLIAINLWSVNDKASRELNVEFEKAYKIYCDAKLKGGYKGIIVLNICLDLDPVNADVTLKKDGINKTYQIPSDFTDVVNAFEKKKSGYNIVFDSNGNMVYENLKTGTIFNSINQLITR